MNISLNVLDEYAKILTAKQANKLYESKVGKTYKNVLYENYEFSLPTSIINEEARKSKVDFMLSLNENHQDILNQLSYKIEDNGIVFKTSDREVYRKLQDAIHDGGISGDTIMRIRDKKY